MVIWDYFMRRKWLLLTVLAVFMLSGTVSGYFLQHSDTFVVDDTVVNQPENVEVDTADTVARVQVPILSEEEAVAVAEARNAANNELAVTSESPETIEPEFYATNINESNNEVQGDSTVANTAVEVAETLQTDDPSDIDIPMTGETSQININEAWKTLFSAWQQATMSIMGVVAIALAVILFARFALWTKIH